MTDSKDKDIKNENPEEEELESEEEVEANESNDKSELKALKEESASHYDKFIRVAAELDNIKKRNAKERFELIKYAGEGLARDLLDIVDSLDIAINQENKGTFEEFEKGIGLIANQFKSTLERHSIKAESLKDKSFDPEKAEALATAPCEEDKIGKVVEEFKKAYYFKDKLLRPAQVVVGKAFEKNEEATEESEPLEEDQE